MTLRYMYVHTDGVYTAAVNTIRTHLHPELERARGRETTHKPIRVIGSMER